MSEELVGSLAGLLAAMAWAANGLLIRAHGAGLHAVAINAMRCTIASVFFVAIWPFVSSGAPVPPQAWLFLILSTLLGLGLGDSLYFEAIKRIGVARAMPISMAYPVPAALGAVVLLHEPLGPLALLGRGAHAGRRVPGRGAAAFDPARRRLLARGTAGERRGGRLDLLDAAAAATAATG